LLIYTERGVAGLIRGRDVADLTPPRWPGKTTQVPQPSPGNVIMATIITNVPGAYQAWARHAAR
jgi:hypothetical protein